MSPQKRQTTRQREHKMQERTSESSATVGGQDDDKSKQRFRNRTELLRCLFKRFRRTGTYTAQASSCSKTLLLGLQPRSVRNTWQRAAKGASLPSQLTSKSLHSRASFSSPSRPPSHERLSEHPPLRPLRPAHHSSSAPQPSAGPPPAAAVPALDHSKSSFIGLVLFAIPSSIA